MKKMGMFPSVPNLILQARGKALKEARDNLRETLELFFETASSEEIKTRQLKGYVTRMEVAVG